MPFNIAHEETCEFPPPLDSLFDLTGHGLVAKAEQLALAALCILSMAIASARPMQAQEVVVHLYVDPINGDDGSVQDHFNPGGAVSGYGCPGVTAPHQYSDPNTGLPLLHVPYPFKTIGAAIGYIQTSVGQLPNTAANGVTWAYAVIHLLPGVYSSTSGNNESLVNAQTPVHRDIGLPVNGESFPLDIPTRVSIQGTSTLNTIIDGGQDGTAFIYGGSAGSTGQGFIDSVTFYACGTDMTPLGTTNRAAVWLAPNAAVSQLDITNCVFARNEVGLLVESNFAPPSTGFRHTNITIWNNTFAWNQIGIANTNNAQDIEGQVGHSILNIVNNIFDASPPYYSGSIEPQATMYCMNSWVESWFGSWPGWPAQPNSCSAFEGVSWEDMRIALPGGVFADTNAYEQGVWTAPSGAQVVARHFNSNDFFTGGGWNWSLPSGLRQIQARTPNAAQTPSINIAAYTGFPNQAAATAPTVRGIVFINDLMCQGSKVDPNQMNPPPAAFGEPSQPSTGPQQISGSMLDFRLAPTWSPSVTEGFLATPTVPSPLIDLGYSGSFPITMENGQTVTREPGSLPVSGNPAYPFHSLFFDGEGYGNPRVYDHPLYANNGPPAGPQNFLADIGADEVHDLIISGYRFGTTSFVHMDAASQANLTNKTILNDVAYLIGPANTQLAAPVELPRYREYTELLTNGGAFPANYLNDTTSASMTARPWHSGEDDGQQSPFSIRPYTAAAQPLGAAPPSPPPAPPPPATGLPAVVVLQDTYRATHAEVAGHLRPDWNPWWAAISPILLPSGATPYSYHTIPPNFAVWQSCGAIFNPLGIANYNLFLPVDSHRIHPPGTWLGDRSNGFTIDDGTGSLGVPTMGSFGWLDATQVIFAGPPAPLVIRNPMPTPTNPQPAPIAPDQILGFNAWSVGGDVPMRSIAWPGTIAGSASPTLVRFSVEWADAEVPWQQPTQTPSKNAQSFTVWSDRP